MSATNRGGERKAYDFYATPPETIRSFLANFDGISSGDRILEPSAGNGQIIKVLRESGYDNRIDAVELRPEERSDLGDLRVLYRATSGHELDDHTGLNVAVVGQSHLLAERSVGHGHAAQGEPCVGLRHAQDLLAGDSPREREQGGEAGHPVLYHTTKRHALPCWQGVSFYIVGRNSMNLYIYAIPSRAFWAPCRKFRVFSLLGLPKTSSGVPNSSITPSAM